MTGSNTKVTVLVVDDDETIRRQLFWTLDEEYRVIEATTRAEAIKQLHKSRIDVIVCDLHLPPNIDEMSEGLAIVDAARAEDPAVPVIVITGSASKRAGLEAVNRGAYGFFEKPFDADEVSHLVRQAARLRRLEQENLRLRTELEIENGFARLVGKSSSLERVLKQARAVATTSATVLLTGENGTGKEMLAMAIHEESPRAKGPFVAVSCAALPETLIESELFGYEKGAFTGALTSKEGRFELADGGTLLLDEIGELSPAVQVKLLRILHQPAFVRLGGTKEIVVDIRLIAATNRDLEEDVKAGRFREDLFYRINVVPLCLPPLRERRDDIPLLAIHFALWAAEKHARTKPTLDAELLEALQEYEWPGNVRELENLMERLIVLSRGAEIGIEFLPEKMLHTLPEASTPGDATLNRAIIELKRRMISDALNHEGGNKVAAARRLGISRSYLHRLINEFGTTDTDAAPDRP